MRPCKTWTVRQELFSLFGNRVMVYMDGDRMDSWRVGDITVTRIVEIEVAGGTKFLLPDATPDAVRDLKWMAPHFMTPDGQLIMSVHALLIDTGQRKIIVDTCIGNDKPREIPGWDHLQTSFLEDLAAEGFARETIDTVMCTHLHIDHVGWNTMLIDGDWVPTFPNARYLMAEKEFNYWQSQETEEGAKVVFADSVKPVFDAGLVDLIPLDHEICDGVWLQPTVGHTPGHVSVRIHSKGEDALITGDFIHHPCQLARPDWCSTADYDRQQSETTRRNVFDQVADTPMLVIGTHFATPTAGYIKRDGTAYKLDM